MGDGLGGGTDRANCSRSCVMCIMVCPSPQACSQLTLIPPVSLTARLMQVSKHLRANVNGNVRWRPVCLQRLRDAAMMPNMMLSRMIMPRKDRFTCCCDRCKAPVDNQPQGCRRRPRPG